MEQMHILSAMVIEDELEGPDITLHFNKSNWGQRWTAGSIPSYNTVESFRKHLISLASLSLKGFRKMSSKHVLHLLPQPENDCMESWFEGLLSALTDTQGDGERFLWTKFMEIAVAENPVGAENGGGGRKTGQTLCRELLSNHLPCSKENPVWKTKESGILESLKSITLRENEKIELRKNNNIKWFYQGFTIKSVHSATNPQFHYADIVLKVIVESAFGNGDSERDSKYWGNPVIPKIKEIFADFKPEIVTTKISQSLLYVVADMMKVSLILQSAQQTQDLLGNYVVVTQDLLHKMRVNFSYFMECTVPVLCYFVLCKTVKSQKLLSKDEVVRLLRKAEKSRRVMFKNIREIFQGTSRRVKSTRSDNLNITIKNESTQEEIQQMLDGSCMDERGGCVEFILNEIENEDKDTTSILAVRELLREELMQPGEAKIKKPRNQNKLTEDPAVPENGSRNAVRQLSFAGAISFLNQNIQPDIEEVGELEDENSTHKDATSKANNKVGGVIDGSDEQLKESNNSVSSQVKEVLNRILEQCSTPRDFGSLQTVFESVQGSFDSYDESDIGCDSSNAPNSSWNVSSTVNFAEVTRRSTDILGDELSTSQRVSFTSEGSSGSNPSSSTKIQAKRNGNRRQGRHRKPFDCTQSIIDISTSVFRKRTVRVAPINLSLALDMTKFKLFLSQQEQLKENEKQQLSEYIQLIPESVSKSDWFRVAEIVTDTLLNKKFMIQTAQLLRPTAAVLIARYVSRLAVAHKEGLKTLDKKNFEEFKKDESKNCPCKWVTAKFQLMKDKIRASDSVQYITSILSVFYPREILKSSAKSVVELCQKPKRNKAKAKKKNRRNEEEDEEDEEEEM